MDFVHDRRRLAPRALAAIHLGSSMSSESRKRFLNVGGNSKNIGLPPQFDAFEHLMLDIDPQTSPDILCDARKLKTLDVGPFDAIYCAHNMEHYYRHDVREVLAGFLHVLRPGGFALHRRARPDGPDGPASLRSSWTSMTCSTPRRPGRSWWSTFSTATARRSNRAARISSRTRRASRRSRCRPRSCVPGFRSSTARANRCR